jgi:transketolase
MRNRFSQKRLSQLSLQMRKTMIQMGYDCGTSAHFGGGLSMVESLAVLYDCILKYDVKNKQLADRDRFILSKGHGVLGFYAALYTFGLIGKNQIKSFQQNESEFIAHPIMDLDYGIESSNGSLGHGLSLGIGIALAARLKKKRYRTFVMLGDGECNEGSVWEAVMSAAHFKLNNLVAIVDRNKMQNDGISKDVMEFHSLERSWKSFGWDVISINGHDLKSLYDSLKSEKSLSKPRVIIANTVKGRGVSFMEGVPSWHHGKLTEQTYQQAIKELNSES